MLDSIYGIYYKEHVHLTYTVLHSLDAAGSGLTQMVFCWFFSCCLQLLSHSWLHWPGSSPTRGGMRWTTSSSTVSRRSSDREMSSLLKRYSVLLSCKNFCSFIKDGNFMKDSFCLSSFLFSVLDLWMCVCVCVCMRVRSHVYFAFI